MRRKEWLKALGTVLVAFFFSACAPDVMRNTPETEVPSSYSSSRDSTVQDSTNTAELDPEKFFKDSNLVNLIDTALKRNQELNITLQEIKMAKNEVMARKGEYLPSVGVRGGAGVENLPRYTRQGAVEETTPITHNEEMPENMPDLLLSAYASWEVDIWNKLHDAKRSANAEYLATVEGKNFMVTNLVAEIANSYYELLALEKKLDIVQENLRIQKKALRIVKLRKESAQVTELAVQKFKAEVKSTQSLQYDLQQSITETENRINYLVGRYPQSIPRSNKGLENAVPDTLHQGVPSQLLDNRPDVREAKLELKASKLSVKSARKNFYPSLELSSNAGLRAFKPEHLISPESILYSLIGDLTAPLINRNKLKATYYNANAEQIQAVYEYQRTILKAYIEVANRMANIENLEESYQARSKEVEALKRSIDISNDLFRSARADYMEVLMTQRDALEARFELVETKKEQMTAVVDLYQALGGGW